MWWISQNHHLKPGKICFGLLKHFKLYFLITIIYALEKLSVQYYLFYRYRILERNMDDEGLSDEQVR